MKKSIGYMVLSLVSYFSKQIEADTELGKESTKDERHAASLFAAEASTGVNISTQHRRLEFDRCSPVLDEVDEALDKPDEAH